MRGLSGLTTTEEPTFSRTLLKEQCLPVCVCRPVWRLCLNGSLSTEDTSVSPLKYRECAERSRPRNAPLGVTCPQNLWQAACDGILAPFPGTHRSRRCWAQVGERRGKLGRQVVQNKWGTLGRRRGGRGRNKRRSERKRNGTVGVISFSQLRDWKQMRDYFSAYITCLILKG